MKRKAKRWLAKVKAFLASPPHEQAEQYHSIKKVLKKLKEQQKQLKAKLVEETNLKRREALEDELEIIKKQRHKAIDELKSLKDRC
ncbi:hypothetical protein H0A36_09470 [Endozoicomonas sp. SM1973]|uniref:Uncharacterized protein n=1 Tax=Spartinivicinus marinus TaxID=2994442 RepID=A0A853HWW8_9GAMM|nr:hypothetical protein [Spartinivicinus marinus]MCX4028084.1 hypothetical protein [Spartinivicinus marinus]NYZ66240.1 hypothetical protein [Spartinivicinus marinus]